jgi:dipicolinate synthase subunit A
MLRGLGANVTVAARKERDLASVFAAGLEPLPLDQLARRIGEAELVFNTVPAMVLPRSIIERMNPECVILDVASAPGGTDFQAASERGIRGLLAPSLPGKVAPKTAGRIVARVIVRHLENLATVSGRRD